jgi:DNA-binding protein H-NS
MCYGASRAESSVEKILEKSLTHQALNGMSRKQLEKLQMGIKTAMQKLTANELKAARAAATKVAAKHGFSLDDLMMSSPKQRGPKAKTAPKVKSQPKFKDLTDPSKTWTGQGRRPQWYRDAVTAGTTKEEMLISALQPKLSAVA